MPDWYWLTEVQFERIKPHFLRPHGRPRVDDRRLISGIIHVIRNGLRWRDTPADYGPHKTLYNRFARWSRLGVFDRIFGGLVAGDRVPDILMIDATHLKAHRTASILLKKRGVPRHIGRTKGGLNSKLHAVVIGEGKPIIMALTAGQVSDHIGAKITYPKLPEAKVMIADKGYDSNEYRAAISAKGITSCIPLRKSRKVMHVHSKALYKPRHRIENMFAKLKDWRRIATRYDRCADTFFAAITIAATVIFRIN
jgi:transposase